MKNIRQYIIIGALAFGCILLIIQLVKKSNQLAQMNKVKQIIDNQVQKEAREIARKVNSKGIETVIYDINHNKGSSKQIILGGNTRGIIDTTALALDLRARQLKQIMVLKTSLEAENLRLKKQINEANILYYTYSGNGLKLKFIPPSGTDTIGHADFSADVKISAVQFWRKNWYLGPKRSFLAITSDNPMFKVNSVEYLEIEQKQPAIRFKIQGNSAYDLKSSRLTYGPSAQLDLGRLSLRGFYGRSLKENGWKTHLSASYDLLIF
jgi:hypothetical protein